MRRFGNILRREAVLIASVLALIAAQGLGFATLTVASNPAAKAFALIALIILVLMCAFRL